MIDGPGILLLSGPPCAGKSTVARLLMSTEAVTYVEVDAVFSLLFPTSDRNRSDRLTAYDAAHQIARILLERGLTPLLECTYARIDQRASLASVLTDADAPLWVVEIGTTPDEAVGRFGSRRQETDLDEASLRERVENYPHDDVAKQFSSSGTASAEQLTSQIARWMGDRPQPVDLHAWVRAGRT